jgi:hypothetical protein
MGTSTQSWNETQQTWTWLMQAKHSLEKLFESLLTDLLKEKPPDPLQFIIDSLSMGPEHAAQASWQCTWSLQHHWLSGRTHADKHGVIVCQPLAGCKIQATQQLLRGGLPPCCMPALCKHIPSLGFWCPQDAESGLPQHRKEKLLKVFKIIDKVTAYRPVTGPVADLAPGQIFRECCSATGRPGPWPCDSPCQVGTTCW